MSKGKVVKWFKTYGFIEGDHEGKSIFFHINDANFRTYDVQIGMEVEYDVGLGKDGRRPAAKNVVRVNVTRTVTAHKPTDHEKSHTQPKKSEGKGYRFHNPYNFVRYVESPPRVKKGSLHVLHRCPPPPHDRWVGLSGKIKCQLKVKTPLFVSGSEGVTKDANGHHSYRFFSIGGRKAIPASTLRGTLRSTYEAVTNSCFAGLTNSRLSYRLPANEASKLIPGIVVKKKDKWAIRLLTGSTGLKFNRELGRDDMQYAAWLQSYWPVEPSGTLFPKKPEKGRLNWKIRALRERTQKGKKVDLHGLKHGMKCFALLKETEHPFPSIRFWDVIQISRRRESLQSALRQREGHRIEEGWLCLTNQNSERKHSERFFFCSGKPIELELSDDVCLDYRTLMREYFDRHEKDVKKQREKGRDPSLATLPKSPSDKGEVAFSRFAIDKEDQLKAGTLVYVGLKGTRNEPEVEFMTPVSISRVLYERSVSDLLPKNRHLHRCTTYDELCPACRLFGWVHGEKEEGAYSGRVQFGHAFLSQNKDEKHEAAMRLQVLSSPKPTTTRFYLTDENGKRQDGRSQWTAGYNNRRNQLRGRKFYRHFVPDRSSITLSKEQQNEDKNWDQNRTIVDPVGADAEFTFEIRFENLADVELGALLWSLTLDGKAYHKMGYGKPLGLGSVQIHLDDSSVTLSDRIGRYRSIQHKGEHPLVNWQDVVELFKQEMTRLWKVPFDRLAPVRDLLTILNKNGANLPVHYPYSPDDDSNGSFEWFVGNSSDKGKKLALPLATEKDGLPLMNKKGKVYW